MNDIDLAVAEINAAVDRVNTRLEAMYMSRRSGIAKRITSTGRLWMVVCPVKDCDLGLGTVNEFCHHMNIWHNLIVRMRWDGTILGLRDALVRPE